MQRKQSNAFVNLYEFHLNCYGMKLNPMHGCSGKSCRGISVQLMVVQTPSRRGWGGLSLCARSLGSNGFKYLVADHKHHQVEALDC